MIKKLFLLICCYAKPCYAAEQSLIHYFHVAPKLTAKPNASNLQELYFIHYSQMAYSTSASPAAKNAARMSSLISSLFSENSEPESSQETASSMKIMHILFGKVIYNLKAQSGSWQIMRDELYTAMNKEDLMLCLCHAFEQSVAYLSKSSSEQKEYEDTFVYELLNNKEIRSLFNEKKPSAMHFSLALQTHKPAANQSASAAQEHPERQT